MQKKIYTGLLLLAVILIWGYVGYNFINGFNNDDIEIENPILSENEQVALRLPIKQQLKLNYTDPFLKTDTEVKTTIVPTNKQKVIETVKKTEAVNTEAAWPNITYKGLIQNQSKPGKTLGLLAIDGKDQLVQVGDKLHNVLVISIKKDNIELSMENQKRNFLKI